MDFQFVAHVIAGLVTVIAASMFFYKKDVLLGIWALIALIWIFNSAYCAFS